MSHSSPLQTTTHVHNMQDMLRQRQQSYVQDQCILSAVNLCGQLIIGTAFYLYSHVSTPGYLSILLGTPVMLLIAFLSLWLAKRTKGDIILEAAGKIPGKGLGILLSLVFLLDAQMAAFAISSILSDALPHLSPLLTMIAVALMMAAAIGGEDEYALPRLSRFMRWPILIAFAFCAVTAMPHGNTAYLAPALGYGAGSIFRGGLWMSGCLAGAACPLLIPRTAQSLSPLREKGRILYRPLLTAMGLSVLYALISACMLPVYALARPENMGFKMLLFTKISGYSPAWSLLLFAQLFLMLIALASGVLRSASLFAWTMKKKRPAMGITISLLLFLVPAAALKTRPVEQALITLAPFRGAMVLAVMIALVIISLIKGRKSHQTSEEQA